MAARASHWAVASGTPVVSYWAHETASTQPEQSTVHAKYKSIAAFSWAAFIIYGAMPRPIYPLPYKLTMIGILTYHPFMETMHPWLNRYFGQ